MSSASTTSARRSSSTRPSDCRPATAPARSSSSSASATPAGSCAASATTPSRPPASPCASSSPSAFSSAWAASSSTSPRSAATASRHTPPRASITRISCAARSCGATTSTPGRLDDFPRPRATSALGWKGVFYLGFGAGPLRWNNLFAKVERHLPEQYVVERYADRDFTLHLAAYTDERTSLQVGNEAQLEILPGRLDLVWSLLYGEDWDGDNDLAPSDHDRSYYSTVLRLQAYATPELHVLLETSLAREVSRNGDAYRSAGDSVFRSTDGLSDPRGLEHGDSDTRDTWQLKLGPVLSPLGLGVYTRPSFRLLYGLQWSSQINAFGNSFVESLDQFNQYGSPDQRWHHVVALEVEAWF